MKRKRGARQAVDDGVGDRSRMKSRRAEMERALLPTRGSAAAFLFGTSYRSHATIDTEISRTSAETPLSSTDRGKLVRLLDLQVSEALMTAACTCAQTPDPLLRLPVVS